MGVSLDRISAQKMQQFVRNHDIHFPIVLDPQYDAARMYNVRGTPTTYLINHAGKVIGGATGPKDWGSDTAKRLIKQLLDNAP